jgi:hypothetical protein
MFKTLRKKLAENEIELFKAYQKAEVLNQLYEARYQLRVEINRLEITKELLMKEINNMLLKQLQQNDNTHE